jgi:hypothetical protein
MSKYSYFPYPQVKWLAWKIIDLSRTPVLDPQKAPYRQVVTHVVTSPHQAGPTEVRVLLPERMEPGRRYPVVLVLPVRAQHTPDNYGDGLLEVERLGLHNRYETIFAMPTFTAIPWYCDHPSLLDDRQESYIVETVVPFVDRNYPTSNTADGRYLLGFSKSGWGAWSLLLRRSDLFGRAVAWDVPFMKDNSGPEQICGGQENFLSYMPSRLVRSHGSLLGDRPRLIMMSPLSSTGCGGQGYGLHHHVMHNLLKDLNIPHKHLDGPHRRHDWHSGWVEEAVSLLLAPPP